MWMALLVQVCSGVDHLWYVLECQWCVELWHHAVGNVLTRWPTIWWNDWQRGTISIFVLWLSWSGLKKLTDFHWLGDQPYEGAAIWDAWFLRWLSPCFLRKRFIKQKKLLPGTNILLTFFDACFPVFHSSHSQYTFVAYMMTFGLNHITLQFARHTWAIQMSNTLCICLLTCFAVSNGMRVVKLCIDKILQFLTGGAN